MVKRRGKKTNKKRRAILGCERDIIKVRWFGCSLYDTKQTTRHKHVDPNPRKNSYEAWDNFHTNTHNKTLHIQSQPPTFFFFFSNSLYFFNLQRFLFSTLFLFLSIIADPYGIYVCMHVFVGFCVSWLLFHCLPASDSTRPTKNSLRTISNARSMVGRSSSRSSLKSIFTNVSRGIYQVFLSSMNSFNFYSFGFSLLSLFGFPR